MEIWQTEICQTKYYIHDNDYLDDGKINDYGDNNENNSDNDDDDENNDFDLCNRNTMILVNQATGVPGPGLVVSTLPRNVVFSRFSRSMRIFTLRDKGVV